MSNFTKAFAVPRVSPAVTDPELSQLLQQSADRTDEIGTLFLGELRAIRRSVGDTITEKGAQDAMSKLYRRLAQSFVEVEQPLAGIDDAIKRGEEGMLSTAARHRLPEGADVKGAIEALQARYAGRGVELVCVGEGWRFQTAGDLSWLMTEEKEEPRRLSKAAQETLAIIAYHQPVTRAEIEAVRGVQASRGTLDVLLELGLVRMRGRRSSRTWVRSHSCRACQFMRPFDSPRLSRRAADMSVTEANMIRSLELCGRYCTRSSSVLRSGRMVRYVSLRAVIG